VTIAGASFSLPISVSFGGVLATHVTVDSDTQITVTVPAGAQTGKIAVKTVGGIGGSTDVFTVTQ
jgi:hypothetical protein